MQQRIGGVALADGTGLATASVGDGPPLLYVGGWLSHLELSWELPEERAFLERLGRGRRLVRYDREGNGLSDPAVGAPSLARELEQLAAVAAPLGPEPIDVVGASLGALVAVAWAASRPAAVRRLVLYGGWATGSEIAPPAVRDHVLGLVAAHWGLGADVLTEVFAPDAPAASRAGFGRYQRAASSADTARGLLALSYALDVRAFLPRVSAPTLVVHRAGDRAAPLAQAEALAAGIPGSELVVLPGRSHLPWAGDTHALVTAIRRFLGLSVGSRAAGELTPRQEEVAALVAEGRTNREIAGLLGIEERSAEGHVERIRLRLGLRSRAQIAAWVASRD
jgi:pimeloyl-ACP methyl ester carboxylesterase